MKKDITKIFISVFIGLIGLLGLFFFCNTFQRNSYGIGEIVAKYRNGYNNQTYHIVIKKENTNNEVDLTISKSEFNKFKIKDRVYVKYNVFKKIQMISLTDISTD